MGLEQCLAFAADFGEASFLPCDFFGIEASGDFNVVDDVLSNSVDAGRFEADSRVVGGYPVFDSVGCQVALGAAVATLSSQAVGVLISAAMPLLMVMESRDPQVAQKMLPFR